MQQSSDSYSRLLEVIKTLRGQNGCPWDKNQTPKSMRQNLIEEVFEAVDAITLDDVPHIKEELGDCFFNLLIIAYMFEQNGSFSIQDVFNDISDKLIRRHPHVYKDKPFVPAQWDKIKATTEDRVFDNTLDQVPSGFPPLLKSYKMLSKAAKLNFDWASIKDTEKKVYEELKEVEEAYEELNILTKQEPFKPFTESNKNQKANDAQLHLEEELGDLLLSVANLSRKCNVDPNVALDRANKKFYKRFTFVEQQMKKSNIPFEKQNLSKMEEFWRLAKQEEII